MDYLEIFGNFFESKLLLLISQINKTTNPNPAQKLFLVNAQLIQKLLIILFPNQILLQITFYKYFQKYLQLLILFI